VAWPSIRREEGGGARHEHGGSRLTIGRVGGSWQLMQAAVAMAVEDGDEKAATVFFSKIR